MSALAADHRNDVVATLVALIFGIIGKFSKQIKINPRQYSHFLQVRKLSMAKLNHENFLSLIQLVR